MSILFKIWNPTEILLIITINVISLSASSIELTSTKKKVGISPSISHELNLNDSKNVSHDRITQRSLMALLKSGFKALTLGWAVHFATSSATMPRAMGSSVTNINQSLTYVINGPPVKLLPIIFSGNCPCYLDIEGNGYLFLGSIRSSNPLLTQLSAYGSPFHWGVENVNFSTLNDTLSNIFVTPERGANYVFKLRCTISDLIGDISGILKFSPNSTIIPHNTTHAGITSSASQSPTLLTAASTIGRTPVSQISSLPVTTSLIPLAATSLSMYAQNISSSSMDSIVLTTKSMGLPFTILGFNTSDPPLISPMIMNNGFTNLIIGVTVTGVVLLLGIIVAVVAVKKCWYNKKKISSIDSAPDKKLDIMDRNNTYANSEPAGSQAYATISKLHPDGPGVFYSAREGVSAPDPKYSSPFIVNLNDRGNYLSIEELEKEHEAP